MKIKHGFLVLAVSLIIGCGSDPYSYNGPAVCASNHSHPLTCGSDTCCPKGSSWFCPSNNSCYEDLILADNECTEDLRACF